MDQFDSNVQTIINFLKDEGYEAPELSIHRVCYREFKKYLLSSGCEYRKGKSDEWQEENVKIWPKWRVKKNRICIKQLEETYELGYPRKYHRYIYPIWYSQLNETLSQELDSYIENIHSDNEKYRHDVKKMCSDFLSFLQYRGKDSIIDIDYEDAECYFYHETERNKTTKALYVNHARAMLIHYYNKGMLKRSLGFHMNSLFINQIVSLYIFSVEDIEKINACREESLDFPAVKMWGAISEFIKVMAEHCNAVNFISTGVSSCMNACIYLLFWGVCPNPLIALGRMIFPALSSARSISRQEISLTWPFGIRQSHNSHRCCEIFDRFQSECSVITLFICLMRSSVSAGLLSM